VLDNLYIDPISNKDRITYLVTAFYNEEETEEQEYLSEIHERLEDMQRKSKKDMQKLILSVN